MLGAVEEEQARWTETIESSVGVFDLRLGQLWRYRDLVVMLVVRDFVTYYKQTILGPLWFVLQPLITMVTYALIFGRAAGLGPEGVPMVLFYLSGITVWNFFSECLTRSASVFKDNASMFGKVYFPRLVMPTAIVLSNLIKFALQLSLFTLLWAYHLVNGSVQLPGFPMLLVPFVVVLMGLLGSGAGMVISALTTKYKDLVFLVGFGVQLLMFSTPVIIPLSRIPEHYRWMIQWNPLTPIVETFRSAFFAGPVDWLGLLYSTVVALGVTFVGAVIFNRVEKTFTDTV